MSETNDDHRDGDLVDTSYKNARLIWWIYLASIFLVGVPMFVGVLFAYFNRPGAEPALRSNYTYAIWTFWLSLIFFGISGLLTIILIGYPMLVLCVIWLVYRCWRGLSAAANRRPL